MMLTHGDTAVVRRERMRGHFMGGILELFPLALNLSASFLGARAGLGVLPSPLWGGLGVGVHQRITARPPPRRHSASKTRVNALKAPTLPTRGRVGPSSLLTLEFQLT